MDFGWIWIFFREMFWSGVDNGKDTKMSAEYLLPGSSPRIFEWVGRIVGRVANLPQITLKIGKNTGLWPLHSRIWGGGETTGFQRRGGQDPPPPPSATPLPTALIISLQYEIMAYLYSIKTQVFKVDVGISMETVNFPPKNGYDMVGYREFSTEKS